ncbi:MAG: 6,7-dimethyl-8-ribityllumazine synthase [Lysobacteraceae bacterium]|nr:MAG: 6,7-dimethyl-8-ribityllumazine synthase [Xanthomonadaceae bacterium]
MKEIVGSLVAGEGDKYAIVAGRFNSLIVDALIEGANECLIRHGVDDDDITLIKVPGAFEIPIVAQRLAATGDYRAVLALGAVIRGATPHFDFVAGECASGIMKASLDTGCPIIFGVLTTETIEQALERAGTKAGNKGADAAMAALETVSALEQIR